MEEQLRNLDEESRGDSDALTDLGQMLEHVLHHVEGDICPVCDRNFREVGKVRLKTRINTKLKKLGADVKRIERNHHLRKELQDKKSEIANEVESIRHRISASQEAVDRADKYNKELIELRAALRRAKAEGTLWLECRNGEKKIEKQLRQFKHEQGLRRDLQSRLQLIADQLQLDARVSQESIGSVLNNATKTAKNNLRNIIAYIEIYEDLNEVIIETESTSKKFLDSKNKFQEIIHKLDKLKAVMDEVEFTLRTARKLKEIAIESKRDLLKNIFNENLNFLWKDLFERLVPDEPFSPALSDPISDRGRLRASTQAVHEDNQVFTNVGSVMSSANLNTAALTLFFALHLIEKPRIPILILDDPVQSMDDVHVVQLAALLRGLVKETKRQLLIAVHDRNLYDYLCLELGPQNEGATLTQLEIIDDPDLGFRINSSEGEWKPDRVVVGG